MIMKFWQSNAGLEYWMRMENIGVGQSQETMSQRNWKACGRKLENWNCWSNHFSPGVNNLQDFLNDVVEDEAEEDDLNAKDKMVPSIDIAQQLKQQVVHSHSYMICSYW